MQSHFCNSFSAGGVHSHKQSYLCCYKVLGKFVHTYSVLRSIATFNVHAALFLTESFCM